MHTGNEMFFSYSELCLQPTARKRIRDGLARGVTVRVPFRLSEIRMNGVSMDDSSPQKALLDIVGKTFQVQKCEKVDGS